jgi:hypothetical protein
MNKTKWRIYARMRQIHQSFNFLAQDDNFQSNLAQRMTSQQSKHHHCDCNMFALNGDDSHSGMVLYETGKIKLMI